MSIKCDHLLIDGRHALWRSADAFKDLSALIGGELKPTGAMYGWLGIMLRSYRKYGGTVEVAWEGKRSRNFRKALYPGYKLRKPSDEKMTLLHEQMTDQEPRLKAILRALGVRQWEGTGAEADDVLAQLAAQRPGKVIIYTGDGDLRQLADDRVTIVAPGWKGEDVIYTPEKVLEKHGVHPYLIPDLKAIGGDTGDCIPGVKGIGLKTAAPLVATYGSIEDVIKAAYLRDKSWPVAERFMKMIINEQENIRLYRQLTVVDSSFESREIVRVRDKKKALAYFNLYKFRTLAAPSEFYDLWRAGGSQDDN